MREKLQKYNTTNTQVIVAIIFGVLFGIYLPELALKQQIIGQMFISFLKMIVIPLVFASIYIAILGLGNLDALKNIGIKTLGLYMFTTALSVALAILITNMAAIEQNMNLSNLVYEKASQVKEFSLYDMVLSFIPTNIFAALSSGAMMQIIVFSVMFGVASLYLQERSRLLMLDTFTAISDAMLKIAEWIIKLTPLGVFSLISYVIAEQGIDVILGLYKYIALVLIVLILHASISLPITFFLITRKNPFRYLSVVREAPIMAFSTASSAATLPVSMRIVEDVGGVDKKTASFVLPLGATVSMDGTAAYLTVAVLYIATLANFDLSLMQQISLGVSVVALSIGVAALPSASLVMMVIILNQVGLPVEYIAVIVAVDRILDMARTSVNVTSDLMVVKIVDTLTKRHQS